MTLRYDGSNVGVVLLLLFSRSFFSFPWLKTDSTQVPYPVLLMADGYEETDWPYAIHAKCRYCMGVV